MSRRGADPRQSAAVAEHSPTTQQRSRAATERGLWRPAPRTTWQWQLTTPVDESVEAAVYDIDGFDNPPSVVASLHAAGRRVICYIDAGAWESFRPDAGRFPKEVLGKRVKGWPDERWLDIRRLDVLGPIMAARLDMCRDKGFDGVELDEVDGYTHDSGFPLTFEDQLAYNRFLADEAHARGLAAGLKNDVEQVRQLLPSFEFAIIEQCWQYSECDLLEPFLKEGKAVFHAEYYSDPNRYCPVLKPKGFSSILKRLELDAYRRPC